MRAFVYDWREDFPGLDILRAKVYLRLLGLSAQEAERIRNDVAARPIAMDECLSKAAVAAEARWKAACKARRDRAGCALTARENQELRQKESEERNTCLLRFSVTVQ